MPGMENLQAVYAANSRRLKQTQAAQNTTPSWMTTWQKSQTPQNYNTAAIPTPAAASRNPGNNFIPTSSGMKSVSPFDAPAPVNPYAYNPGTRTYGSGNPTAPGEAIPTGRAAAMQLWESQNQEWNKANEDTLVDRGAMLKELADFKAQSVMNNQNMEKEISDLNETLRTSTQETLDKVRNSFAAMGRAVSPYVMAGISSRLALQNRDKVNLRRSQLEMDRAQIHGAYLEKLNSVLADTKRTMTMDPSTVLAMMKELGGGDATGGGFSGGGRTISTGGAQRNANRRSGGSTAFGTKGLSDGITMTGNNSVEENRIARSSNEGSWAITPKDRSVVYPSDIPIWQNSDRKKYANSN